MPPSKESPMSKVAAPKLPARRLAKAPRLNRGWCLDSYLKTSRFGKTTSYTYLIGRICIQTLQMLQQNPADFEDTERVLVDLHVVGGDDQLGIDAVQVSAGIGHDAVGFFLAVMAGRSDPVEQSFVRRQDADDGMEMDAIRLRLRGQ